MSTLERRRQDVPYLVAAFILLSASLAVRAEPAAEAQPLVGRPALEAAFAPTVRPKATEEPAASEQGRVEGPAASKQAAGFVSSVCSEIGWAAAAHNLPAGFLTRLIWQESRFNPAAVSRAGAQGIAQFMPATARWRGLANPFDPHWSVRESARWLGELRGQFGNLGLAAAAYNAGPKRVQDWLTGKQGLPQETKAYVRIVTGRAAEEWSRPGMRDDNRFLPAPPDCQSVVALRPVGPRLPMPEIRRPGVRRGPVNPEPKWSLQLVGDGSELTALAEYGNLQKRFPAILGSRPPLMMKRQLGGRSRAFWYQIRVAENSREGANALCSKLRSAGGQCLVLFGAPARRVGPPG